MNKKIKKNKNTKLEDSFIWLEKNNQKTQNWIKAEQKKTSEFLSKIKNKKNLKKRLSNLFKTDSMRIPVIRGDLHFFRLRKANEENPSIYVRDGFRGKAKLLIDVNKLFRKMGVLQSWDVSKDAKLIALGFSRSGNDKYEIRVFDVKRKKFIKDFIPSINYPYFSSWNKKCDGFWYIRSADGTKKGEEKYFRRIYFHKLGEHIAKDKLFYGKNLEREDSPGIKVSHDKKYLIITVFDNDWKSKIFFRKIDENNSKLIEITKGIKAESYANINGSFVYLFTNHKAPNTKVLRARIKKQGLGKWESFIPESKNKLESWVMTSEYLFLEYLVNASSRFFAVNLKNKNKKEIKLPSLGTIGGIGTEFESGELFYSFSSFNTPPSIYRIDFKNFKSKLFWRSKINARTENLIVKQEWFHSKDKTPVPMFITHKRGIKLDGKNPTLVYAYGGFGVSMTPNFWTTVVPFLEDGGIFVVVNIRGGGEFGESWHKSSILKNKQRGFDDFAYALKYLTKRKYTNREGIVIWGASNGGLLVSATMIEHPELFRVAIISVAVTDLMRYHLFNGGRWWIAEYGDPENKKMRKHLLKYSPYHNIKDVAYPSLLFMTSDQDDRVHPMHSYKMVARLRKNINQKNPILLRIEKGAGHVGANTITPMINEYSDMFSFVYKELGM